MENLHFEFIAATDPKGEDVIASAIQNPAFGTVFTDHMVTVRWTRSLGCWHDAKVEGRRPFALDPACAVLHYAQEIFEGMKAYRTEAGKIVLFRPDMNARRFAASAARMGMPELPEELFIRSVEQLVKIDHRWVPDGEGSLYIRPFMFASESFLGVRPSDEYTFCVIACPVGAYFKGNKTVTVWVSENFTRAAAGGTGTAKCGGNYAASLLAQKEAAAKGCDQVVYLDAVEHRWVEELGGMNIFFVLEDSTIITPPLVGTILAGITRDSIIELGKAEGFTVSEMPYSFEQWKMDAKSGRLREVFACGTAAAVSSIGKVRFNGGEFTIGDGTEGATTTLLRQLLVGVQRGRLADARNWVRTVY
jgi:branched-chain amino acid aminotransferase